MRQVVMIVAFAIAVGVIAFLLVGSPSKSGPDIPAPDRVRATPTSVLRAEVPTPTPRRVVPERTSPPASEIGLLNIRVSNSEGDPIQGARVFVLSDLSRSGLDWGSAIQTNPEGQTETLIRFPARIAVFAVADGYAWGGIAERRLDSLPGFPIEVTLKPEQTISGNVRENFTGRFLPGATVTARLEAPQDEFERIWDAKVGTQQAQETEPGIYRVPHLFSERSYAVTASTDRHLSDTKQGVVAGTSGVNFVLSTGGQIAGRVESIEDWGPVPGATVECYEEEKSSPLLTTQSGEDGNFVLQPLRPGLYRVLARKGNTASARTPEQAEAVALSYLELEKAVVLTLRPRQNARFSGKVFDLDGAPQSGVAVLARSRTKPDKVYQGRTDGDGFYTVTDLEAGEFDASAQAEGIVSDLREVRLEDGEERSDVDFHVYPAFYVLGRVLSAEDQSGVGGVSLYVEENPNVRTVSGSNGSYRLGPVAWGSHVIVASPASGYVSERNQRQVTIVNEDIEGIDFTLVRGGGIRGEVRSATGPIAGAEVYLVVSTRSPESIPGGSGSVRTDPQGRYELGGSAPGAIVSVAVRAQGFRPHLSETITITTSSVIDLPPIILQVGGASIYGTVTMPNGDPMPNVQVVADVSEWRTAYRFDSEQAGWWRATARTNLDGYYEIGSLPPGDHKISARLHVPLRPVERTVFVEERGRVRCDLVAGIQGREGNADISGRVTTSDGTPVPGMPIRAVIRGHGPIASSRTDASGSYRISGLPENTVLSIEASGYGSGDFMHLGSISHHGLTAPRENVDFVFGLPGGIAGTVVDEQGRPIRDFNVTARLTREQGDPDFRYRPADRRVTEGRFYFRSLIPGEYRIFAEAPGYPNAESDTIHLEAGQLVDNVRIVFRQGVTLRGQVLGVQGNDPVSGVQVFVQEGYGAWYTGGRAPNAVTDTQGRFTVRNLTPGRAVRVMVEHGLFAPPPPQRVEIPEAGNPPEIVIRMQAGGSIRGILRDHNGQPVSGARISAHGRGQFLKRLSAVTGSDGVFYFRHIPAGRYDLQWQSLARSVQVVAEQEVEVDMRMPSRDR